MFYVLFYSIPRSPLDLVWRRPGRRGLYHRHALDARPHCARLFRALRPDAACSLQRDDAGDPKDKSGKAAYFEGTPIPTSLGLDFLMAYWISQGWIHDALPLGLLFAGTPLEVHPVVLLFAVHGCMMTSKTIHIPKP